VSDYFAVLQRALPQHPLSRWLGHAAQAQTPWLRRALIRGFIRHYGVDLSEAERTDPDDYASFNDFFTRALAPGARPLYPDPAALISPADGTVSQAGRIDGDRLLQAKGTQYRLASLIGEEAPAFHGGSFVTVYLAPRDYHRVHLPTAGTLQRTTAIPGALFSVNARTEASISDLFCRNERLVCWFDTAHGRMLVVLVGALIVAGIRTVWGGPATPYARIQHDTWQLPLERGAEIGHFQAGSTVIVCCEPGRLRLNEHVCSGARIRMGEALGRLQP
jgi:phosphatidylserine decarboxylase